MKGILLCHLFRCSMPTVPILHHTLACQIATVEFCKHLKPPSQKHATARQLYAHALSARDRRTYTGRWCHRIFIAGQQQAQVNSKPYALIVECMAKYPAQACWKSRVVNRCKGSRCRSFKMGHWKEPSLLLTSRLSSPSHGRGRSPCSLCRTCSESSHWRRCKV